MKRTISILTAGAVIGVGAVATAVPFTANFETDQSANFTVTVASTTNDASANFVYDSSTHVQASGPAIFIGTAPNTGISSTTKVVRLDANVADGTDTADAVSIYPNVTGLGANWRMTWDCWQNYNGGVLGGSGSTNMLFFGATSAKTVQGRTSTAPAIAGDGFWFTMSGEGGASVDYRFYDSSVAPGTIAANNNGALWLGGAAGTNMNNLDPAWSDSSTGFFKSPTFENAGAMGKAWIVINLNVSGTNATLSIKRPGDAGFQPVATATVSATATNPFIGFSDINAGQASPVSDQFVLVDNLTIDNTAAGVNEWSLY
jgi:hypothetical protein